MNKTILISQKSFAKIKRKKAYLEKKFRKKRIPINKIVDIMLEV
jgi:CRISPR/Cas system-associated endonuclease Cas1